MTRGAGAGAEERRQRALVDLCAEMSGLDAPVLGDAGLRFFCLARPAGEIPEHQHEQLQITLLFEPAACVITWRDSAGRPKAETFNGPAVVMVAPHQRHVCSWRTGGDIIGLYLNRRLHRELLPAGVPSPVFAPVLLERDTVLWQFASALRRLCFERNPGERKLIPSVAKSVAIRTTELIGEAGAESERFLPNSILRKIEDFVRANLAHDIHVDDLAQCAGYSVQYFSALFRATTAITPADFIFERRMLRAQELLRSGEYNVRETAKAVGYWDAGHFTGKFRKRFGCSPRSMIHDGRQESVNRPTLSFVRP